MATRRTAWIVANILDKPQLVLVDGKQLSLGSRRLDGRVVNFDGKGFHYQSYKYLQVEHMPHSAGIDRLAAWRASRMRGRVRSSRKAYGEKGKDGVAAIEAPGKNAPVIHSFTASFLTGHPTGWAVPLACDGFHPLARDLNVPPGR